MSSLQLAAFLFIAAVRTTATINASSVIWVVGWLFSFFVSSVVLSREFSTAHSLSVYFVQLAFCCCCFPHSVGLLWFCCVAHLVGLRWLWLSRVFCSPAIDRCSLLVVTCCCVTHSLFFAVSLGKPLIESYVNKTYSLTFNFFLIPII